MKQNGSSRKVNEQARQVIAEILLFEISDSRLRLVTVTGCEVSFDRSYCNVFYTAEPGRYESVAQAFTAASGRIRSLMAHKLSWRVAPELRFLRDPSVDEAERIAQALARDAARNELSSRIAAENAAAAEAAALAEEEAAAGLADEESDFADAACGEDLC